MKWNKLYLELNLHAVWPAGTGQWCRNGMTRGGSRTSKWWRAPGSLCRGLCGAARQQFITALLSMEEHFVLITGILTASVFHYSIANEVVSLVFNRSVQRTVVVKVCSIWRKVCNVVTTCCLSRASLKVESKCQFPGHAQEWQHERKKYSATLL